MFNYSDLHLTVYISCRGQYLVIHCATSDLQKVPIISAHQLPVLFAPCYLLGVALPQADTSTIAFAVRT